MSRTPVDTAYDEVRQGNHRAYAKWVSLVEPSLLRSLRSFAKYVDVEAVMQESLLRMWVLAPRLELSGADASLRYVHSVARNLALKEAERWGKFDGTPPEGLDDTPLETESAPDPALRARIKECLAKLTKKPRQALLARMGEGRGESDKDLAAGLGMKLNTFLQNVVRARKAMKTCLEAHGISLPKVLG